MPTVYPLSALRAVALHTQRLDTPPADTPPPTPDSIYDLVEALGCVQIDTLHVVARSHHLVIWSRLGSYDLADLDGLLFSNGQRRLFEHWRKAASIIPLRDYPYIAARMKWWAHKVEHDPSPWWVRWLESTDNRRVIREVHERIERKGGMRAADFEDKKAEPGGWWNWKASKVALEYLFASGEVLVSNRVNFQRVYDLAERVLPEWVEREATTHNEANRHWIEQGAKALGVCRPAQAAEYAYLLRGTANPIIRDCIKDGTFVEVEGQLADGSTATLIAHRDQLPLLERATEGQINPRRTTFLSFFDSLFWAKDREKDLWGFSNVLEAYKREPDRIWGYFCLPILYHDRLVGRFDPVLNRKAKRLTLKALYLEPGVKPDDEMVSEIAAAMRDFMDWQGATELVIEKSDPAAFGKKLLKALR